MLIRIQERLVSWLVISAFGPYLFNVSLRTEHALIYGLLPFALIALLFRKRRSVLSTRAVAVIVYLLASVTVWTLSSTYLGNQNYAPFVMVVASMERYLRPIAIIIILAAFICPVSRNDAVRLLGKAGRTLITLLSVNTVIVIVSTFYDLTVVLQPFVSWRADGVSVASLAATNGRFTGIFNQPMESGLTYSLGVFMWVYLSHSDNPISFLRYVSLYLLLLGGVFSVSKVFLLGCIPLGIIFLVLTRRVSVLTNWRMVLPTSVAASAAYFIISRWSGIDYLKQLFGADRPQGLLYLYTAGRFGGSDFLTYDQIIRVWSHSALYGLGFASMDPLDSAYIEFFAQGGLVALFIYLAILIGIGWVGWVMLRRGLDEGFLLLILVVFTVGTGIGAPVITSNRFATIFWTVFVVLVYVGTSPPHPSGHTHAPLQSGGQNYGT